MKKLLPGVVALLVTFSLAISQTTPDSPDQVNWTRFSDNLTQALKSDNIGVKYSAMQLVIRHSDYVNVSDAVYDVMREFRNNENRKVRMLSLITLYKMNNSWALDFLERTQKFEKDDAVKDKIVLILTAARHGEHVVEQTVKNIYASLDSF